MEDSNDEADKAEVNQCHEGLEHLLDLPFECTDELLDAVGGGKTPTERTVAHLRAT